MERIGRKPVMLMGTLAGTFAGSLGALAAWTASFPLLCAAAMVGGTGLAVVHQYRFAAMESVSPDMAGTAAARVLLGGLGAAWLGPQIALAGGGAQAQFPFMGGWLALAAVQLFAMMVLVVGYRASGEHVREVAAGGGRAMATILRQPVIWAAISAAAIGYAIMSFIMTATPLSMTEVADHPLEDAKWVIQMHIMAMYLPSLVSGWLIRVVGIPRMMGLGLLAYLGCVLLAFSGITFHHYLSALVLLGIGWNFLFVGGTTLLPQGYRDEERFRVQGLNDLIVFGSQATAAMSAGAVLAAFQWTGLLLIAVPFLILHGVLMAVWLMGRPAPKELVE